ncbi:MAG: hypothetical protein FJ255_12920 [Phycisphaerae bacterium]|nr:hypothetical protein [Phycisphaerae bacterium]
MITRPHRGTTVLTLGVLAIVFTLFCGFGWILGIIAWVMGNSDLKAMAVGAMDPSGEGNTKAGKVCGIVSVALAIAGIVVYIAGLGVAFARGVHILAAMGIAILGAAAAGQTP